MSFPCAVAHDLDRYQAMVDQRAVEERLEETARAAFIESRAAAMLADASAIGDLIGFSSDADIDSINRAIRDIIHPWGRICIEGATTLKHILDRLATCEAIREWDAEKKVAL